MTRNSSDKDVTLTKPSGESKTFGPMPTRDAVLVAVVAGMTGNSAIVQNTRR